MVSSSNRARRIGVYSRLLLCVALLALAQTPSLAQFVIKSAQIVSYAGTATMWAGLSVQSATARGLYIDAPNNIYGSAIRGSIGGPVTSTPRSGGLAAGAHVRLIVKCVGITPSSVTYTLANLGFEQAGGLLIGAGAQASGSLTSVHGGLPFAYSTPVTPPHYKEFNTGSVNTFGPELGGGANCYTDADGDWVFWVDLNNVLEGQAQWVGSSVGFSCSAGNLMFLKKVNNVTIANPSVSYPWTSNTTANGVGTYP